LCFQKVCKSRPQTGSLNIQRLVVILHFFEVTPLTSVAQSDYIFRDPWPKQLLKLDRLEESPVFPKNKILKILACNFLVACRSDTKISGIHFQVLETSNPGSFVWRSSRKWLG